MRFFRRSLIALGVAATLPTLVFAAIGGFYFLRAQRQQVESATLTVTSNVVTLSDASMQGHIDALNVLSTSVYFENLEWEEFHGRVQRVRAGDPAWVSIRLIDLDSGEQIFDTEQPFGSAGHIEIPDDERRVLIESRHPVVGRVARLPTPALFIYVPVLREDQVRFVLVGAVRTQKIQDILLAQVPKNSIAAVVDRQGNFVARTRDYETRVATPATSYVRDAMLTGTDGFYRGKTYEGFENYTAFRTSAWSGLSAHVAIASTLIDTPTSWSFVVVGIATLASLALAGLLALLVLRDMSERRRAEDTLRQSQKMEAVGQLTGGIAHDFNNLLTAVIGNLDMIRSRTGDNERLVRLVDNALEAARRGAKLTSQLLAFSRSQRLHLEAVDLERLVGGMNALMTQSAGPDITVRIDVADDARYVTTDPNQLELALLNLTVNARDAMPRGGLLTVSTHSSSHLHMRDLPRRRYVELRVTDTGEGMSEEILARATEPFFTTKEVGQGTGLGLSQVYGIVRESGGSLQIESELGKGTTIHMLLPAVDGSAVAASAVPAAALDAPAAHTNAAQTSILVVDDDRQVRRFVAGALRNLKYNVVDVDNGAGALEHLDRQRFDVLLVDFAMPGMNGTQVAHAARALQSDLRILIVSGYADSAAIEEALGATPTLRKPFDAAELAAAVRQVLR